MITALACRWPTYTVLISTLPHIALSSQLEQFTLNRSRWMWSMRFLQQKCHHNLLNAYGLWFQITAIQVLCSGKQWNHWMHKNATSSKIMRIQNGKQHNNLISNFRRILNVVCFLLGNSPASEFYMPTFRTLCLFHLHRQAGMKMEQTECSKTLAYKI